MNKKKPNKNRSLSPGAQNPKIIELEKKVAGLTSGWQRTQADFLNFKKQTADERIKLIDVANSELILEILPVLDNFQLASHHVPDNIADDNWTKGIVQIKKQLELILENSGLKKTESIGEQLNPELHEAIEEVGSDKKTGTIVEEILAGYTLNNNLIRAAKVKVAK